MRDNQDPTKIKLQTNVKIDRDPTIQRMSGVARHEMTPFDVPFISQITDNIWQGGCDEDNLHLHLPKFFKSLVSLYPWERYKVERGQLLNEVYVTMYDSLEQSFEQVEVLAALVNQFRLQGPVLVHCQAGLNRSSLIVARSLMLQGMSADEAISKLRTSRSPACLCNPTFEDYLHSL
jgi:protein tyrosine phosphatase